MSTMSKSLDRERLEQLAADPAEHGAQPVEAQEPVAPRAFRIPEAGTPWWQTAKDCGAWTDRQEGDVGYIHFGSVEALRVYTMKVCRQAEEAMVANRPAAQSAKGQASNERELADLLYVANGRINRLTNDLESSRGCVSQWVKFGSDVTDALGLAVMSPDAILKEIARLKSRTAAQPVQVQVPEGWRLVPVELLDDALTSVQDYRGGLEFGSSDRKLIGRLKSAMAAAPLPPAQPEPVNRRLLSLLQDAVASFGPHLEGGDDQWLTAANAAIAGAEAQLAQEQPEPRVEFYTDEPVQSHSMSIAEAARVLSALFTEFPGGVEEMQAAQPVGREPLTDAQCDEIIDAHRWDTTDGRRAIVRSAHGITGEGV